MLKKCREQCLTAWMISKSGVATDDYGMWWRDALKMKRISRRGAEAQRKEFKTLRLGVSSAAGGELFSDLME